MGVEQLYFIIGFLLGGIMATCLFVVGFILWYEWVFTPPPHLKSEEDL
jgi:hypothetical protein